MVFIRKAVTYNEKGVVVDCLFCNIINRKAPGTIIAENDKFVAFKTIAPATSYHILICPREHIRNLKSLSTTQDAVLVQDLVKFGKEAMGQELAHEAQFSFHRPPYNSIDHLHLHAIGNLHTRDWRGFIKYSPLFTWVKTADAVIEALLKGPSPDDKPDSRF